MPRRESYVPKHRGPVAGPKHRGAAPEPALMKGLRTTALYSGVAVAATGMVVSSSIASDGAGRGATASAAAAPADLTATPGAGDATPSSPGADKPDASTLRERAGTVSRSDRRTAVDAVKQSALNQESGGQVTATEDLTSRDPRTIAQAMLGEFGFSSDQFSCLDALYMSESGWNVHADNPSSSAYGIPQALPGEKMASAGSDWEDDAATQIRWGLGYIDSRYGTPCGAWSFKQSHNWY